MSVRLSLLVPTIESRKDFLDRLRAVIDPQLTSEVELLTQKDNGQNSIGKKRNQLLAKAKGKYIAFIDDDDLISCDYVGKVLQATQNNPDVVGMHLIHFWDGNLHGFTYHSTKYESWYDKKETTLRVMHYYRCPNHLNPVKKEIATSCAFPEISMGEDKDYSYQLRGKLKTEYYIQEPIYYYLFRSKK